MFNTHSVNPDQTPLSVVSDLGRQCLHMSLLWDARLTCKWARENVPHRIWHRHYNKYIDIITMWNSLTYVTFTNENCSVPKHFTKLNDKMVVTSVLIYGSIAFVNKRTYEKQICPYQQGNRASLGTVCGFLVFWLQIAIEPFA